MVKTRLSKVLAMLLALTMVLSTMVIDFTAFAAAGDADFTITAKIVDTDKNYNNKETVTVEYWATTTEATAQNIGSFQFKATAGTGLSLTSLVANAELGGTSNKNLTSGKIAWARVSGTAVTVPTGTEGLKLATATFAVSIGAETPATAEVSVANAEITLQGYDANGGVITPATDTANLWNITVAFSGDIGIKNDVTGTAYVKYGEPGLWKTNDYAEAYTPVEAEADDTYRLYDENAYWKVSGVEGYKTAAEIAGIPFTADATAVATTVKQYDITFEAGEGQFAGGAPAKITIDTGKTLSTVSLPDADDFTAPPGKNFAGFKIKNTETVVNGETVVESDLILVAIYSDGEFAWSVTENDSTVAVTAGVTADKVKHGTNVTFTVTPDTNYVVTAVSYKVGGAVATAVPFDEEQDCYVIPGSAITGNIAVEVTTQRYYTVIFGEAEGVTYEEGAVLTAYVAANGKVLYKSPEEIVSKVSTFELPEYSFNEGQYRADGENKWKIGESIYTDATLGERVFDGDTTIKPYVIKYWVITFKVDANGKWADESTADVVLEFDDGAAITGYKQPIDDTKEGYVFDDWSEEIAATATETKTYTANFKAGEFNFSFTEIDGIEVTDLEGATAVVDGTATFGQDVKFKLNVDGTKVTLGKVEYKVNGNAPIEITKGADDYYVVPGNKIVAATTVSFETTGMVKVTFEAVNGNVGQNTIYVEKGAKLTAEQLAQVNAQPNAHYEADKIYIIENETETETSVDALLAKEVTAAFAVKYTYKLKVYAFNEAGYDVAFETGKDVASYGKDLQFKVTKADTIVLGVKYTAAGGEAVAAEFDAATGIYTIAGANVTGDIVLVVDAVAGSVRFIEREDYAAQTNTADRKILVLAVDELDGQQYQYNSGDMYWSSKYNAYVAWVADTTKAALVPGYLTKVAGDATAITYSGDINGANGVTAADAGIINDCLHNQRVDTTTDLMLFELDVEGNESASTADMVIVLTTATN